MTTLREAAQQALGALEIMDRIMQRSPRTDAAITAIREALAEQPAQHEQGDSKYQDDDGCPTERAVLQRFWRGEPIPTEHYPAWFKPAQQQEPVAWRTFDGEGNYDYRDYDMNENYRDEYIKRNGTKYASWVEPLYTAPPQRKPLEDEEIFELENAVPDEVVTDRDWCLHFARAIERAHGIGGDA